MGLDINSQESPPAWTQEAYRPPCSKYSLCCSIFADPPPLPAGLDPPLPAGPDPPPCQLDLTPPPAAGPDPPTPGSWTWPTPPPQTWPTPPPMADPPLPPTDPPLPLADPPLPPADRPLPPGWPTPPPPWLTHPLPPPVDKLTKWNYYLPHPSDAGGKYYPTKTVTQNHFHDYTKKRANMNVLDKFEVI